MEGPSLSRCSSCLSLQLFGVETHSLLPYGVSTVAARQGRNISQQKLTIGLDLGDRNSWYCVVNEAGQIQLEQRVRTNEKESREIFGAMLRSRIALKKSAGRVQNSPRIRHFRLYSAR